MNEIWISLRRNINCASKISVSVELPSKRKEEENPLMMIHPRFIHYCNRNRFHELEMGEGSRRVMEMIFQGSWSNPRKCKKIKRILRVKNPMEIISKFEKYRESVMMKSGCGSDQELNPRSSVDGNELLRFYGTTMKCCGEGGEVCRELSCSVCRVIQSGFNTSYNKLHGIRLSSRCERMSDETKMGKNTKRAVIVCRTIAGRMTGRMKDDASNAVDHSTIVLRNPTAVLPCFVIVF